MTLQIKTHKKLQKENVFVDVFTDMFNESMYGFIRKSNNDFLLLEYYNDNGLYNGIIVLRLSDITRIKWDNNDINSTQKLISKHSDEKKIAAIKIDSIQDILKSINMIFKYVCIHIQDIDDGMCIIGEIEEMDESTLIVKEFGTRATLDRGRIMISLDDITRIDAGGIYETGLLKTFKKSS